MKNQVITAILEKIQAYDSILLFRHIRNDGDCVGATKGLKAILKASFPEKSVKIIDPSEPAQYLAFLGPDDGEVPDEVYEKSLGIVLDTGNRDRISNPKFSLCRELIKIDHHIENEVFGDLSWVEPEKSSACELVVDFYAAFPDRLVLTKEAALYLYTGPCP